MEMTVPLMTGLYCVIVVSSRWVSTCCHLVPVLKWFSPFQPLAVSQCDKGLLGVRASVSQKLTHTSLHTSRHRFKCSAHMSTHANKLNQTGCTIGHTHAPVRCHSKSVWEKNKKNTYLCLVFCVYVCKHFLYKDTTVSSGLLSVAEMIFHLLWYRQYFNP